MWYYICIVVGAVVGWGLCALFVISAENKEIRRLRDAIEGALRIKDLWYSPSNDPQYKAESIAISNMLQSFKQALNLDINGEPKGERP